MNGTGAAKLAKEMGFPIAGFVEEIYEGAEVLIPGTLFGYESEYEDPTSPEVIAAQEKYNKKFIKGEVMKIVPATLMGDEDEEDEEFTELRKSPHFVVYFVILTPDGLQVPLGYGKGQEIFFALPEETEEEGGQESPLVRIWRDFVKSTETNTNQGASQ